MSRFIVSLKDRKDKTGPCLALRHVFRFLLSKRAGTDDRVNMDDLLQSDTPINTLRVNAC
jgi:hypothetical protein